jgi:hypothetical protein
MSDQKPKVTPTEPKPKTSEELSEEALDAVSGGMIANLGVVVPKVTGASSLSGGETDVCISST